MPSQTFSDVTRDMLERIASRDDAAGFEFRIDQDRPAGTVSGKIPLGEIEASFALDAGCGELTVTILRKPAFLPEALLWSEFNRAIGRARAESTAASAGAGS